MATQTLFITLDFLKRNSFIQNNVDDALLKPLIGLVQDKYITPVLGSELYNRLVTDIQSGAMSASSQYKTLLEDYVQATIVQYCIYEGLEQIASQTTNKGVQNKNSDFSSTADESRVNKLEDKALQNGNFYSERIIRYLRANHTLFPELNPTNANYDTIFPQVQGYFSGINIPPLSPADIRRRRLDGNNWDTNYNSW